jgi:hypothetical protein
MFMTFPFQNFLPCNHPSGGPKKKPILVEDGCHGIWFLVFKFLRSVHQFQKHPPAGARPTRYRECHKVFHNGILAIHDFSILTDPRIFCNQIINVYGGEMVPGRTVDRRKTGNAVIQLPE